MSVAADSIVGPDDPILVTGAAGFIGVRVVRALLDRGFRRVRCLVRPSSSIENLRSAIGNRTEMAEVITGNLLSSEDCLRITRDTAVIYHLAAGTGTKSFPDAFMNSVVTTRNLLDAIVKHGCLKRFVSLSSFAVYSNRNNPRGNLVDESAMVEPHPESRSEAYCYAKVKQDELIAEYGREHKVQFVLLRPGVVYGPGKNRIPGRVGTDSFGIFLNFGGFNPLPLTYVDNCADAIVLAGMKPGVDGEVFNIVDDNLPSSCRFLRLYSQHVRKVRSIYVPHLVSFLFCWLWGAYSRYSQQQIPPVFTAREWTAYWKRARYSNEKLKSKLGWTPRISTAEGLRLFFQSCRERMSRA